MMKILTKNKQEEIGKCIAYCHYIAECGMISGINYEERLDYMAKIIENLASITFEIGGESMENAVNRYVKRFHDDLGGENG